MAIVGIVALGLGLLFILLYNTIISKRNNVEQTLSSIDVYLKMRYDMIPNLIAMVKKFMTHESQIFNRLAELRAQAASGAAFGDNKIKINKEISQLLGSVLVQVENYPQLRSIEGFTHLQQTLTETEAQISAARRTYNAAVTEFNNSVDMFPTSILAKIMGLSRRALFEVTEVERKNVDVDGLFKAS